MHKECDAVILADINLKRSSKNEGMNQTTMCPLEEQIG